MAPLKPAQAVALVGVGAALAAIVSAFSPAPAHHRAERLPSSRPVVIRHAASHRAVRATMVRVTGPGLSLIAPVQQFNVSRLSSGPVQVGATTYADSVRFTCGGTVHVSSGDIDYPVTGYASLATTIAVVPGLPGAASVSFFNNGSGAQVAGPYRISPGHPRAVRVRFPAASQLEISCTPAARSRGIGLALANPVLAHR